MSLLPCPSGAVGNNSVRDRSFIIFVAAPAACLPNVLPGSQMQFFNSFRRSSMLSLVAHALGILFFSSILAACGGSKDRASSQVAAKVNDGEISVHQVNFLLRQQPGLKSDQLEQASQAALQRLIDQELAVQKAMASKMDRDPAVLEAIEAARRAVLAGAYLSKVSEGIETPTQQQIDQYYRSMPALFEKRRIYAFEEITALASDSAAAQLREKLKGTNSPAKVVQELRTAGINFRAVTATQPAENIPLHLLNAVGSLSAGQSLFIPQKDGFKLIVMTDVTDAPLTLSESRAAISQFLLNDKKRKRLESEVANLRASAKISQMGMASQQRPAAKTELVAATQPQVASSKPADNAASNSNASPRRLDADVVNRGLGIK